MLWLWLLGDDVVNVAVCCGDAKVAAGSRQKHIITIEVMVDGAILRCNYALLR